MAENQKALKGRRLRAGRGPGRGPGGSPEACSPKATVGSLGSGCPAPGPRLRPPHRGAPPGGPPQSASARSTPAEGTQEGLGFWPPASGHSICVSSIPRQTSRLTAWVLLPSFSLSAANFSPVALFLRLLLVIPPTIFSHLGCGISPHSLLHFFLFKIFVYFCHTTQYV